MTQLLLDHGACANAFSGRRTPLHCAAGKGHAAVVSSLLASGASPHIADTDGRLPVALALTGGHAAAAALLQSTSSSS
jgi:ankyrin repeat protein